MQTGKLSQNDPQQHAASNLGDVKNNLMNINYLVIRTFAVASVTSPCSQETNISTSCFTFLAFF